MTRLMEEALEKVRDLPAPEQDAIATLILKEITDKADPGDLWAAIQKFRAEHDLSDLRVEEVFGDIRDRTPGREVEW
jgi:hypothetical protein